MLETLTALNAAITSFKTVVDLVPKRHRTELQVAIQGHFVEARELIVKAREEAQAAREAIETLRREKEAIDAWSNVEKQYRLIEPDSGRFVMALRSLEAADKSPHWLCVTCFCDQKVSTQYYRS